MLMCFGTVRRRRRIYDLPLVATSLTICLLCPAAARAQATPAPLTIPKTTTTDLTFTSHDGHAMTGRLTLPDSPGRHAVLVFVQMAEATTLDQRLRNAKGELVPFYDLYRDNLATLNVGFFSYEGRGVSSDATQPRGQRIDWDVYNTSTLENKVRDAIGAVSVLQKQPGVDPSQIFLRGVSEGTLLAAEVATRIPKEIKGLVLSGALGSTLKDALGFMATDGSFLQHRGHWDADNDGKISPQEFETDAKGVRRKFLKGVEFKNFDANGDGDYTASDICLLAKPVVDAVDTANFEVINAWLKVTAVVHIPQGWLQDHFAHRSMWDFVSQLNMPIGVFHGEVDALTPVEQVRTLEQQAKAAGKSNMKFHYFPGLDHGLGSTDYFRRGGLSDGYRAMFEFIRQHVERK